MTTPTHQSTESGSRLQPKPQLQELKTRLEAWLLALSWRRRRFVIRYRVLLVCGLIALAGLGAKTSNDLHTRFQATVFSGRAPVWGQIIVRPTVGSGVVRNASVRLVPTAPSRTLTRLFLAAGAGNPPGVYRTTDNAGRWTSGYDIPRGWHYAVILQAEDCPGRLAATVDIGWIQAHRVNLMMRSCIKDDATVHGH